MKSAILTMDKASIESAAAIVRRGGLIVYPTDTVYGLGCDPFRAESVSKLFEAKGRGPKPVPVLCSSASKAEELVFLSPKARRLTSEYWPGALTVVAPLRKSVPAQLSQGSNDLGVRVPSDPSALELIEKCGGWLTGTSANRSGNPSAHTALEARKEVGALVDLILDGGFRGGMESTVVRVVGGDVTILRTGPVGVASC